MTVDKIIEVTGISWFTDYTNRLLEDGLITEEQANQVRKELEADLPTDLSLNIIFGGEDREAMDIRCLNDDDAISEYIMDYLYENYGYYPEYFSWEEES